MDEAPHNPAFASVDLLTAELEMTSSIYKGFSTAIVVKGLPRTVALCREYADAVQIMATIERDRSAGTTRDWQSLAVAPKDGSTVELLVMHRHALYSADALGEGWVAVHKGEWCEMPENNRAGWTWHGLAGTVVAWRALSPLKATIPTRDVLIGLIMEETTDDLVADGWKHIGKPNVLVQGCRFLRRADRTRPSEGYENPEAAAKQFAGFIADRLLKTLLGAPAPGRA